MLVQPFFPDGHAINTFFLPRIYAALIPAAAAVVLVALVGLFAGFVLLTEAKAKSPDQSKVKGE